MKMRCLMPEENGECGNYNSLAPSTDNMCDFPEGDL